MPPQNHRVSVVLSCNKLATSSGLRYIVCTVRQRQLRIYGHVAHFLKVDSAYRAVSERDNSGWWWLMGRQQNSWLEKVDECCWDALRMGRSPARRPTSKNPREWRRRVCWETRHSAYAPNEWMKEATSVFDSYLVKNGLSRSEIITPNYILSKSSLHKLKLAYHLPGTMNMDF